MRGQYATVAELFAEPTRWTQGAEARNTQGQEVEVFHEDACAWCGWLGSDGRAARRVVSTPSLETTDDAL